MDELCELDEAVGNVAECPRAWCPFWERKGTGPGLAPFREAVVEAGCAIKRMGIDLTNTDLAYYLVDLRRTLEDARSVEEAEAAHRAFGAIRPPGL